MSRVGIYAGTFDPVHLGHLAFAQVAQERLDLDKVVFLPERQPRHKHGLTDYADRLAMLKLALKNVAFTEVMELAEEHFSVATTLPQLAAKFPDATLVFLVGSDVVEFIPLWPDSAQLLNGSELAIGVRHDSNEEDIVNNIGSWPVHPPRFYVIANPETAAVSSGGIRSMYKKGNDPVGVSPAVVAYIQDKKLYTA